MKKSLIAAALLSMFVAACGGESNSAPAAEPVKTETSAASEVQAAASEVQAAASEVQAAASAVEAVAASAASTAEAAASDVAAAASAAK